MTAYRKTHMWLMIVVMMFCLANCVYSSEETLAALAPGSFEIHFIDVGQADSALILCEDKAMLIDGGNVADSSLIYSYLENHNVKHLHYMICTHAHEDHVGGLAGALNYASVGTVFCPVERYDSQAFGDFVKYLGQQNKSITVPSHGDQFALGSAQCQIVGPIEQSSNTNNTSIVLKINYGETSFLFAGDAEEEEEQDILNAGYDINSDVLKIGHHGSDTSTRDRWLREVAPTWAVIPVGNVPSGDYLLDDVLSKLRNADVKVYRTDMQGHIICTSDGEDITFSVQRNHDADTLDPAGLGSHSTYTANYLIALDYDSSETIVFRTNSGAKYHCETCRHLSNSKIEIELSDALAQGYEPCKNCNPPTQ